MNSHINSSSGPVTSGSLPSLVSLLREASARQQQEVEEAPEEDREDLSRRFWHAAVRTADLLVARPEPWLGLREEEVGRQVSKWQEEVDRAARTMGSHLKPGTSSLRSEGEGGVQLELVVATEEEQEHRWSGEGADLSISLEQQSSQSKLLVFKSYRDLGCILNRQLSCSSPPVLGESRRVNSRVVGADLYLGQASTEVRQGIQVSIIFQHTYGTAEVGIWCTSQSCAGPGGKPGGVCVLGLGVSGLEHHWLHHRGC